MSVSTPTGSGDGGTYLFGLSRNVVALGLVSMLTDVSSEMIYLLLPLFLTGVLGAGQTFVGLVEGNAVTHLPLLWMCFSLVKAATGLPGGILSDLRGRRGAIIAGWSVYALAYLGFGVASQPWHVWVLLGFYGLYFGLTEGGERALIAGLVPQERQASAFDLFHSCIGIAALPSSLLMGYLYQTFGAGPAFTVGAALAGFRRSCFCCCFAPHRLTPERT